MMKRILLLSNQQLLSLLELLGYEPQLEEEVQYKLGTRIKRIERIKAD